MDVAFTSSAVFIDAAEPCMISYVTQKTQEKSDMEQQPCFPCLCAYSKKYMSVIIPESLSMACFYIT